VEKHPPLRVPYIQNMKNLLTLVFVLLSLSASAQSEVNGYSDFAERPMETVSSSIIPQGSGQIEAGGYAQWLTIGDAPVPDFSYAVPIGLIRYGWKERVELRAGAQWAQSLGAPQQARFGVKWNAMPQKKGLGISLNAEFETSLSQGLSVGKATPMDLRICADWNSYERWSARSNVRLYAGRLRFSAAAMCTTGRQGWSLMAETNWTTGQGWDLQAGAFLAINENSRFDFTYFRQSRNGAIAQEFNTKMYQLRFGYSRRILAGEGSSRAE
jgi:hypothetical protein